MAIRTISGIKTLRLTGKTVHLRIAAGAVVTVLFESPMTGDVHVSVHCEAGSTVTWITLAKAISHLAIRHEGVVGPKASLAWHMVTGGRGALSCDLQSVVRGANGKSSVAWVASAAGEAKQAITATNHFQAPRGSGEILMRSVASDSAHVAAKGSIVIGPKGRGTQTHLAQEALMLDATAKIDAIPALEIVTNDVKASHSASVARVTPETLFYFQSRGIPEREARAMFIDGFIGEMVAALPEDVQKNARALLRLAS